MYELVFGSKQPKAKEFRKHCCNVMFPHVRRQLTNNMKKDHQQAIKEKDTALAFLTDDLQGRDNQIQAIQYENVVLTICRTETIKYKPLSMRTWHCKHKDMCISPSYKIVKTPSPTLNHVMFLMQEIPVKKTLSSLYRNTQRLPQISIIICHIISRGYNHVKGMLN